ncbi:TIR domain-containing protein, partial [Fibrobacterota bacterium]
MKSKDLTILFIEDELSLLREFSKVLKRQGYNVISTSSPKAFLDILKKKIRIDIAILDMQLPASSSLNIGFQESSGGKTAGIVLAKELRKKFTRAPIIFWTGNYDRGVRPKILDLGNTFLVMKSSGPDPVLDIIDDFAKGYKNVKRPKIFLVHGHDDKTLRSVNNYLHKTLKLPKPIILRDTPSHGRTIIEKLEHYAYSIDLVFVLLTPDDKVISPGSSKKELLRSRQNVILELGYFIGILGRTMGKVVLLYKKPIELPSDISGIVYIDISNG